MEGWTRVMNLGGGQTAKAMSGPSSSATLKSGDVSDQFPAGLRVLLVDDDPICLRLFEALLRKCLYEVTTCNRAEIALNLLRNNRNGYDIVISEVHMPGFDGFKLLELVGLEMDLPVIMMSANTSAKMVMKGVTHGACDYLIKPVRMENLKNIWQHVFRKRMFEWKDKEQSGSAEEGERLVKPPKDVYYSSSATEGNWKTSKKRKDVEDELEEKDNTSSLTPHVVLPVDLHQQFVAWPVDLHQQFVADVNQLGIDSMNQLPFFPLNGIFGSPPRPEHVQGFVNISDEELAVQFNSPNLTGVDAANDSMNGIYEQQNRIVEFSPGQKLTQNIVSIAHNEPIALINVADPERDGASIEQNGDEATNRKKQKSSCTLKSDLGITREILEQNSRRKLEDASKVLGVSRSTLKRICREYGIHRWPPRKVNQAFAKQRVVQPSAENIEECHQSGTTRLKDDSSMWAKAEYQGYTMKFRLPMSARKFNLEEKVAQRLNLSIGSFKIEYLDEDNDWIWIACDEDLSTSMSTLSSLGRTTIKMLVR